MGVKRVFLYLSRCAGLFLLSRYLTRRGLRILCYHGFASTDESLFRPRLFINPETFKRRLAHLQEKRYPVLRLGDALAKLDSGGLPNRAVVITLDDGWQGTEKFARPLLNEFSFPATLYITSYHCVKKTPVFQLVVQYMLWKTTKQFLDLSELGVSSAKFSLTDAQQRERMTEEIIRFGEEQCNEQQRIVLARSLGKMLDIDFEEIWKSRIMSLVTLDEIQSLANHGVDIELHTHRHRLPSDKQQVYKEIIDNKAVLEPLLGRPLRHFCYPSGMWSHNLFPWLDELGIRSAVTCDPGLNYRDTARLMLRRFLDGEHIGQLEFEAELAGFSELLRQTRLHLRRFAAFVRTG